MSLYTFSSNRSDSLRFQKLDAYSEVRELANMSLTTLNQTQESRALLDRANNAVSSAAMLACPELQDKMNEFFDDFRAILKKTATEDTRDNYYQRRNAMLEIMKSEISNPNC